MPGKPKPRYSEIRHGMPDEAQRMEPVVRQFMERTLGRMRNCRHGEPKRRFPDRQLHLWQWRLGGGRRRRRPLWKGSPVADVAETDPHRSLPHGILKCWIGRLARRLAGRFRSGRPYAVKIATVTFRLRHPYLLRISRFISPVHHVASLGWLRQSSSRLIPVVCVRHRLTGDQKRDMERLISSDYVELTESRTGSALTLTTKGLDFLSKRGAGLNEA